VPIQISEELTHVDDIEVRNLPTESIEILFSGPLDSSVRLHLISLGGVGRDFFLTRIAWDKLSISWSRAVLPLRMRRRQLQRPKPPINGPAAPVRSEPEELELLQLQQGEAIFLTVRNISMKDAISASGLCVEFQWSAAEHFISARHTGHSFRSSQQSWYTHTCPHGRSIIQPVLCLLRRLAKKCKQYSHLKHTIRSWWEKTQDLLPGKTNKAS